ncbi:hypothetical protein KP509_1Z212500 [Ceratopteris richardii]|nr:hypothetical protein KP509_1Z212500 [Ceratopteris richardii]
MMQRRLSHTKSEAGILLFSILVLVFSGFKSDAARSYTAPLAELSKATFMEYRKNAELRLSFASMPSVNPRKEIMMISEGHSEVRSTVPYINSVYIHP